MNKSLLIAFVMFLSGLHAQAAIFNEYADAGDFASPQDVIGSAITSIQGNIGGDDAVDAFRFYFGGGRLAIRAQAYILDPFDDTWMLEDLPIAFFREHAYPPNPCIPTDPCHDTGLLDLSDTVLSAGNYIVGVCHPTDPCLPFDPPFFISLLEGPTGPPVEIATPVPEPASLALLALGLAALAAWRRSLGARQQCLHLRQARRA